MASDEIRLNKKTFEALASETRIGILKLLDIRQMTITELSGGLDMAKSSVHEHLQKMADAGLVEKRETERKWTYYHLTKEGRQILHPHETAKILILIGLSIISLASGMFNIISRMTRAAAVALAGKEERAVMMATEEAAEEAPAMAMQTPPPIDVAPSGDTSTMIVSIVLILVAMAMGYYAYRKWRKMNPKMQPTAGD